MYLPVYWVGLVRDGPDGWRAALQKFIRALDTRCGGQPILPAVFCLQSRNMSANTLHVIPRTHCTCLPQMMRGAGLNSVSPPDARLLWPPCLAHPWLASPPAPP